MSIEVKTMNLFGTYTSDLRLSPKKGIIMSHIILEIFRDFPRHETRVVAKIPHKTPYHTTNMQIHVEFKGQDINESRYHINNNATRVGGVARPDK